MRGHKHVCQVEVALVQLRFVRKDIQPRSVQLSPLQGFDQGVIIDDIPTRYVDDDRVVRQ
jgi:hypothetical protein